MPSLLRDISWLGIVVIGTAMVIICGEFDLSVGSVYAFVSMIFVVLMPTWLGVTGAFLVSMALSFAIGWLNGWLTWHYKLPSLLVTLGFLFFYRGLVEYVTGGVTIVMDDELRSSPIVSFLGAKFLGLHVSIYLFALLVLIFTLVLIKTQFGNHVQAVGGDVNAALATGVPVGQVKIRTFIISSMLAGFAGIITACSLSSVSTTTASSMEFEAIAATVIGGVALTGGAGSVWGAILGVATLLALKSGMILSGINIFTYQILLGAVLVGLVSLRTIIPNFGRR
ncbi:ABC transporter permease [Rhizobium rhizogenes]|uniref:ABC transporter permease n=1 Tax=Rhizobium rhizogenes TaxID=359 RepID=UPI00235772C8|nr:ABC transporter permease [Rhizobium rhizogenes]